MASPHDELETISDFSPGLNLASSPLTFKAGETDLADNVWIDLDGAVRARPGVRAVLDGMVADIGSDRIENVTLAGLGDRAAVIVVTTNSTGRRLRIDNLSPVVAPASPADIGWRQLTSTAIPNAAGRYRPVVPAIVASEGYVPRPDGRVLHFAVGVTNAPVLLAQLATTHAAAANWNDDYSAPQNPINVLSTPGYFPPADVVLGVNAGSTSWMLAAKGTRVRWSHALSYAITTNGLRVYGPQDWALNDFTELETTGSVTAMKHYRDHVLVFTSSDTFGLSGSPPNLEVVRHSGAIGTVSPHSAAVGPEGVWFYSHPEGLYLWDGSQMHHISERLGGFERRFHSEDPETLTEVSVGYKDRRVWLSVPAATSDTEGHTFMYDVRLQSWVRATYQATQFLTYDIGEAAGSLLSVTKPASDRAASVNEVLQVPDGTKDRFLKLPYNSTAPGFEEPVQALLRVGPMRASVADMRPRWRAVDVSTDIGSITVIPEADSETGERLTLDPVVKGLRQAALSGRAWRLGLLLEWSGAGTLVALICRWWAGRREGGN